MRGHAILLAAALVAAIPLPTRGGTGDRPLPPGPAARPATVPVPFRPPAVVFPGPATIYRPPVLYPLHRYVGPFRVRGAGHPLAHRLWR